MDKRLKDVTSHRMVRYYFKGEKKIPTSEGYMDIPHNRKFAIRWLSDERGYKDKEGFDIEFYFKKQWIKSYSIDFE